MIEPYIVDKSYMEMVYWYWSSEADYDVLKWKNDGDDLLRFIMVMDAQDKAKTV